MIAASDLRIGNWVIDIDGDYFQIEELAPIHKNGDSRWGWLETLTPIPLTEKILLKCGFDTNGIHIFKEFNPRMVLFFNNKNHAEMDLIQDGKSISFKCNHIKYLHELQNLFYSLSKTELIINL